MVETSQHKEGAQEIKGNGVRGMKREEAIKLLNDIHSQCCDTANILCTLDADKRCDALQMAITALQNQPGDILYVRETWKKAPNGYYYYESWQRSNIADITKWHPSIHMPKEAARIWLKVTDVRVERLQEMKPVDVIKEGAYPDCWDCLNTYGESGSQCCYGTEEQCSQCDEVMMEWEKLWNSTIKKSDLDRYGWTANPWVWVIEFERCEKPEGV
jgi:hypothetical protein